MSQILVKSLRDEFERTAAEAKQRKMLLREVFMWEVEEKKREQGKRREEKEERDFKERLEAMRATPAQLFDINARLDRYGTATVEALMENRRALDRVLELLERLHEKAYVLPDGRRVYATANRDAVFDENGKRLGRDVVDPDSIPRSTPTWEERVAARDEAKRLENERTALLAFQHMVDSGQERVAAGDLSKKDMDDLDAELKAGMPPSVRDHLPQDGNVTPNTALPAARPAELAIEAQVASGSLRTPQAYRP